MSTWYLAYLSPVDDAYPADDASMQGASEDARRMNEVLARHRAARPRTYSGTDRTMEYDAFLLKLRAPSVAAWCSGLVAIEDTAEREAYLARTAGTSPWGVPMEPDDSDPDAPFETDEAALDWLESAAATERYVARPSPHVLVVGETREYDHEWALFTADELRRAQAQGRRALGSVLSGLVVLRNGEPALDQAQVRLAADLPGDFEP